MKVKQRLRIASIASAAALLVVVAVIGFTADRVNRALHAEHLADAILTASYERLILWVNYQRTLSERSKQQLVAKEKGIGNLLRSAREQFWKEEDRDTIDELLAIHEATARFTWKIRGKINKDRPGAAPEPFAAEHDERLISQLDMKNYETILLSARLHKSGQEAVMSLLCLAGGVIIFIILVFGLLSSSIRWPSTALLRPGSAG
jgi:hypothetical protein